MPDISFPRNFIWGAATSAYQIEGAVNGGGRGVSIWDTFSHTPGKVFNGDTGDTACDHYNRYKQDVSLMKELGLKGYRFSIAWPRVFPEGRGKCNPKGLDFYKALVEELLKNNIEPVATLYHWDLPQIFQDMGGWLNSDTVEYFAEYSSVVFKELGDMVDLWITQNEPMSTAFLGNFTGDYAPGLTDPAVAVQVSHNLLLSHAEVVRIYRQMNLKGHIGIAFNFYPIHPASESPEDMKTAIRVDGVLNRWFADPLFKGKYPEDILEIFSEKLGSPVIKPGDMELIAGNSVDFLGINYYSRLVVKGSQNDPLLGYEQINPEGSSYTGIGWEIYPRGLYEILLRVRQDYGNIPMYITENGAAFRDDNLVSGIIDDTDRIEYLQGHLFELWKAIKNGIDIRGYYLWSLMDNFEWEYGYSQRFGIIHVDYKTLERTWKKSAHWYRDVICENGF
ncbi:MAG: GH1 family beta-glucosidase [Acetivibrionales bacterium]